MFFALVGIRFRVAWQGILTFVNSLVLLSLHKHLVLIKHFASIMEQNLAELRSLAQKDKLPAYRSLLSNVLQRPNDPAIADDIHHLLETVVTQEHVGLVVGRQVVAELAKCLGDGIIPNHDIRKRVVMDTLAILQSTPVGYEEQVRTSISDILPHLDV